MRISGAKGTRRPVLPALDSSFIAGSVRRNHSTRDDGRLLGYSPARPHLLGEKHLPKINGEDKVGPQAKDISLNQPLALILRPCDPK